VKYTYGPVPSRRLGLSLGVDLVPKKVCTYNCIYCQIGRTTLQTIERKEYIPSLSIIQDVKEALTEWGEGIDYIAISGSGEPTLNVKIGEIIRGVKELSSTPLVVITNGSLLYLEEVRKDLLMADMVMPSLDAVTPHIFRAVNRPHPSLEIIRIVQGLVDFRKEYQGKIWLEILLCRGINDDRREIEALREAITTIQPDKVQLNTVVRPSFEDYASPLTLNNMEKVKAALGEGVEIIAEFEGHKPTIQWKNLEDKVIHLIQRRPVTPDDLSKILGIHDLELTKILEKLTKEERIKYRVFNNRIYYYEVLKGA